MGHLTVSDVDDWVIRALEERAATHGRSAEAEHLDVLRQALSEAAPPSIVERAAELRRRLRSSIDSTDLIRSDRDRNEADGERIRRRR